MAKGIGSGWEKTPDEPKGFERPDGWQRLDKLYPDEPHPDPGRVGTAGKDPDGDGNPGPSFADPGLLPGPAPVRPPNPPVVQPQAVEPEPVDPDAPRRALPEDDQGATPLPTGTTKRRGTKAVARPKALSRKGHAVDQPRRRRMSVKAQVILLVVLAALYVGARAIVHSVTHQLNGPNLPNFPDSDFTPRPYPPSPMPPDALVSAPPKYAAAAAPRDWVVTAKQLRPNRSAPEFTALGNLVDPDEMGDAGKLWLAMTIDKLRYDGPRVDQGTVLHALDAATGEQHWSKPLVHGLCGTKLVDGKVVCAEAVAIDKATGLGTRWRLMALDPATGQSSATSEVAGWFSMVDVHRGQFVVVEQRQPAPHLVVHAFDGRLTKLWTVDLGDQVLAEQMFSTNRSIERTDLMVPEGDALMNFREVEVGSSDLALGGFGATILVDQKTGKLRKLLPYTRLVDTGTVLWGNEGDRSVALDATTLKPLVRTPVGVKLAHTNRDPRRPGRSVPVFLDDQGRVVRVDPRTGSNAGVVVDTASSEVFGMLSTPRANVSGDFTLVQERSGIIALDATGTRPLWAMAGKRVDGVARFGDAVLLDDFDLTLVEPSSGKVLAHVLPGPGIYTQLMGSGDEPVIARWGQAEVGRIRLR